MTADFDLVVRNGEIADGASNELRRADIAISDGRIVAIGAVRGAGREEINARDKLVMPGFVDPHTHYDGQVMWEQRMAPSSNHGVTTVVMGNCGVGFAPCRSGERDIMIELMEGVEDIPEVVMSAGLPWNWETFPDYLDALAQRTADVDFAAQLPHSPLRVYVMGKRGADREPPTEKDLAHMRALTTEAVKAGAIGVSTSLSLHHRTAGGALAPSVMTEEQELLALAAGLRDAGGGVFQMIHENTSPNVEPSFALMRKIADLCRRPISYTLSQRDFAPEAWRDELQRLSAMKAEGYAVRGQVFPRPIGTLYGLDLSFHPFALHPSFKPLARLPLAEKVRALRDPELRVRLLSETPDHPNPFMLRQVNRVEGLYRLGDPPNYEPKAEDAMGECAKRVGRPLMDYAYDALLEDEGRAIFYVPATNYAHRNLDAVREMLAHDCTILGLGDGGAHYGLICDSSFPTYVLTRWVRDAAGKGFDFPWAARALASDTARAVGMTDRGKIAPGFKADLNIIDVDTLQLRAPLVAHDLPAGGRRLTQRADGYVATLVSGVVTQRDGQPSGAHPGKLVRGGRSRPTTYRSV